MNTDIVDHLRDTHKALLRKQGLMSTADLCRDAAAEIERLRAYVENVEAWRKEGEARLDSNEFGSMFRLGVLWASFPIRVTK